MLKLLIAQNLRDRGRLWEFPESEVLLGKNASENIFSLMSFFVSCAEKICRERETITAVNRRECKLSSFGEKNAEDRPLTWLSWVVLLVMCHFCCPVLFTA